MLANCERRVVHGGQKNRVLWHTKPIQFVEKVLKIHWMLPVEATEEILSYLSVRDLRACSAVSRDWHEICNSSLLWRTIAEDAHIRNWGIENQSLDKDQLIAVTSNYLNELYLGFGCQRTRVVCPL
ncbi:hypothetical protein LSTR_LSTR005746 [Laodelphax striatellus]|uniref:F-box domain-containing protein n=1 Tax=Laodelphax striatellus TaxID=195883 RepID=A0A482XIP5_LAOST|nr:hypothetical protein LSTR_LSTR005746 [Laodelphax striatellus]